MGELIGISDENHAGLMPKGFFVQLSKKLYVSPQSIQKIGILQGFVWIQDSYSWLGLELWYVSGGQCVRLAGTSYALQIQLSHNPSTNELTIKNMTDRQRGYLISYQNL